VTLCLAGPEAEREYCGPINDGSDRVDYATARDYLAHHVSNPLQAAAELARFRAAAQRVGAAPHLFAGRRFAAKRGADWGANFGNLSS
jgi:hypothetical protein